MELNLFALLAEPKAFEVVWKDGEIFVQPKP